MLETGKAIVRRLHDPNFIIRYFVGNGIDIGSGIDTLGNYLEFFPLMKACVAWDIEQGDALYMDHVKNESYDFVHSSHCMEHLLNPYTALNNWWRILKPGGHLVVMVPDEDMYEHGVWPPQFNQDHKFSFTPYKKKSWSEASVNIFEMLMKLDNADIIKVERLTGTFRNEAGPDFDQTLTILGECGIEFIVRKTSR